MDSFISALQSVLAEVFDKVFAPVMQGILEIISKYFLRVVWFMFADWVALGLIFLCKAVDFICAIFNIFAGVSSVKVDNHSTYLLDAFFELSAVSRGFLYVTVMAVAICFIFTIYRTVKSMSDMALEDKNPISKVLAAGMRAAVNFMLIPFLCVALLQASTAITRQANAAFNVAMGTEDTTPGTLIFLMSVLDADKMTTSERDPVDDIYSDIDDGRNPTLSDEARGPYLRGDKDYGDFEQVKADFHTGNINFVLGYACAVTMLFVMAGAVMLFIRRLFEILLLYLVAPLFVSTIPLDDGMIFRKWRELFVAKFFSGFGVVFAMKYYLMLVPVVGGNNLVLYDPALPGGDTINIVLKMIIIIGGAWAVYKSQHLILQILNPEAAQAAQQSAAFLTGVLTGVASTGMAAATGGTSAILSAGQMAGKAMGSGQEQKQNAESQKYTGK